ncbi:uncharacterized protein V1518DRAFT_422941 [Limtongia smithiae]|uniref:uncharacterized protein n=1 Tax=Limtongia smithiae TaxID=1125753 RepID=UPI0034CEA4B6
MRIPLASRVLAVARLPMLSRGHHFFILTVAVLIVVSLVAFSFDRSAGFSASDVLLRVTTAVSSTSRVSGVNAATNETLGFAKIILLSLKTRTDRRDTIALMCSVTGIKVTTIIDAVETKDIAPKAYPSGAGLKKLLTDRFHPYVGSWRSHMDVLRYIVDNHIETALVLEDDIDWDVHLPEQMIAFARGIRASSGTMRPRFSQDELARAPYGLDWDIIHFAPSRVDSAPASLNGYDAYSKYTDEYRQSDGIIGAGCQGGWFCWLSLMDKVGLQETERMILPSYNTIGLAAIAVSYTGAQRLLYYLSYSELPDTVDRSISALLQQGYVHGWSMVPPLMAEWKVHDIADSDLLPGDTETYGGANNSNGHSPGIGNSVHRSFRTLFRPEMYWDTRNADLEEVQAGQNELVQAAQRVTEDDAEDTAIVEAPEVKVDEKDVTISMPATAAQTDAGADTDTTSTR